MKTFVICITDKEGYSGETKIVTTTKTKALKAAKLYIKQWDLFPAKIDYCNEIRSKS